MPFLNARQKQTLSQICDTFIPSLEAEEGENEHFFCIRASDLALADMTEEKLERIVGPEKQRLLRIFLIMVEMPLLNFLFSRQWGRFTAMDLEQRTAVLQSWGNSPWPFRRQLFQSLKRLVLFLFYALMPQGKQNPTWPVFSYVAPSPTSRPASRPIQPIKISGPTTLKTAVLIIGSGAGGGVVAGELAAAGFDVLVAEKGGYAAETDYNGQELAGYNALYENEGTLTTDDVSMNVLTGSTLGGGTTVNWMTSLVPPDDVLHEWAERGFTAATSAQFQASLEAVSAQIRVNTQESHDNPQNKLLAIGAEALGYQADIIPRNSHGCVDCTFCNYGCSYGAKQSTLKTYLQEAYNKGARFLVQAHVDRVLVENGRVVGAELRVQQDGACHSVTVRTPLVVVAAGAIHTPALLLRSGLQNKHIGQHLHLHPVTQTWGIYDEPVYSWRGAPQTRVVQNFADLDGRGYGFRIETAPGHPGSYASSLPWQNGRQHKQLVQKLHHIGNHIVLTRDVYGGVIRLDKQQQPTLHYQLHPYDARHLLQGMLTSLQIHHAAGANCIVSPHNQFLAWHRGQNFDAFLQQVGKMPLLPNKYGLFSAHQMSTCRMAANPSDGAVRPTGETAEVENLWVADASVFPTAVGVNPMLTIMAVAHYIAGQIIQRYPANKLSN